jgi:hypothetical protein
MIEAELSEIVEMSPADLIPWRSFNKALEVPARLINYVSDLRPDPTTQHNNPSDGSPMPSSNSNVHGVSSKFYEY